MKSRNIFPILALVILLLFNILFPIYITKSNLNAYYKPINDGCILPCDPSTAEPQELGNNSIYLKDIKYQVVFDYPKAQISANYTLKSENITEQQIGVLFPFGIDKDVTISTLTVAGENIEYIWHSETNISLQNRNLTIVPMQLNVSFDPFEEKSIHIKYSFNYGLLEHDIGRLWYGCVYCLGTSKFWNNTIDSVLFEAWVPKKYAEVAPFVFSPISVTNSREENNYNVYWFEEELWLPSENLLMEYVVDQRHVSVFLYPMLALGLLFLFTIAAFGLIIFYKKVNNLK